MTGSTRTIGKQEFNILFTCAGRRVALMEAFGKALGDLGLKGKIVAADLSPAAPACHAADVAAIVPRAGCIEYIPSPVSKDHKARIIPIEFRSVFQGTLSNYRISIHHDQGVPARTTLNAIQFNNRNNCHILLKQALINNIIRFIQALLGWCWT